MHFNRLITGEIIKYVYWALAGVTVIFGIITALFSLFTGDFSGVIGGLLVTVLGPVLIRIYCELLIVLFKIYETVVEIKNK